MAVFNFYQKGDVSLHLETQSTSFSIEQEQLTKQGFEVIGDPIEANNSHLAYALFNRIQSGKKTIFHFFQKEDITLHLDVNSSSFLSEKEQLIALGFERRGEPVHAQTRQQASKKFKQMQFDELHNSSTFLGASTSGGASNFLRFVTEIDSKKSRT